MWAVDLRVKIRIVGSSSNPADFGEYAGPIMGSGQLSELHEALGESQRLGFFGDRPIAEVIEHATSFARALDGLERSDGLPVEVVDLGSGGGIPGLVIAYMRPDFDVTLIDRRTKRTDFLHRVVMRLGWSERITILSQDVNLLVASDPRRFDAVVARGFGPPEETLKVASELVRAGGRAVISEPPVGDRWSSEMLTTLGFDRLSMTDRVVCFERV